MNREFLHEFIPAILVAVRVCFRSRSDLALAILGPRQQVAVLKRKRPRPKMNSFDLLLWTTLRRVGGRWAEVLLIVKPETVVGWHRAGFASTGVGDSEGVAADRELLQKSAR